LKDITRERFNALAAYARSPQVALVAEELRWLEFEDERVLATLIVDFDGEFSGIIMARDMTERYRWINQTGYFQSPEEALVALEGKVIEILPRLDEERDQGDERGTAVDFFTPVRPPESLHEDFMRLASEEGFSPARGIIEGMMRWYGDVDGNFIEQFQTTGFDARMWELYIFAALTEAGYALDRSVPVPDFFARGLLGEFVIEATTVNPSLGPDGTPIPDPPTETPEQMHEYSHHYMPIRYAGPLTAKLARRYWEHPRVKGRPFVLAIQDFHASMSMVWSRAGLPVYLYGYDHVPARDAEGSLKIVPKRVSMHRWGSKTIKSGFFTLPGADNVSAVIFNSSATISKFNRIGLVAGFGSRRVSLIQRGMAIDHDPNASEPKAFTRAVDKNYTESWVEGMDVYHNPRAKHPLDAAMLPGVAHHRLRDDKQIETVAPEWHPLGSFTMILVGGSGGDPMSSGNP
jgi:hypothetical protein